MQFAWFVLLLGSLHISQLEKIYTLESTGSMKRNGDFLLFWIKIIKYGNRMKLNHLLGQIDNVGLRSWFCGYHRRNGM